MGISKNRGTPKSSILIGCSTINHPFSGTPIFGKHPYNDFNHSMPQSTPFEFTSDSTLTKVRVPRANSQGLALVPVHNQQGGIVGPIFLGMKSGFGRNYGKNFGDRVW